MLRNVHIAGTGSYHPENTVDNQYYIEHFKKYGMDQHVMGLMKKLGREKRYLADENENSITMAVRASKKALEDTRLTPGDIDMIISVSDTPEYLTPCCALIIRNELKASNATAVFDLNSNCTGMLTAMDTAARYLKTDNKYRRVLVVGSLAISPFAREDDMFTYACSADGAAAIILEGKTENSERGLIASRMFTDDSYNWSVRLPACGLTNVSRDSVKPYEKMMAWKPFDFSFLSEKWVELIRALLEECGYKPGDVEHYFMSQLSRNDIVLTLEKLGTDMDKTTFVGDKYGYTGAASPIMALDDRLKKSRFAKDDIVLFCSAAAGYTINTLLYKW